MEVRPGYKQTEVGVIPEDWEVRPLGELGDVMHRAARQAGRCREHGRDVLASRHSNDALDVDDQQCSSES